jgi:hypothetical protein
VIDPDPTARSTLFGVSRGLETEERIAIHTYLRAAWRAQYGRMPSTLSADLETLKGLFRSHALAKRLRDAAEDLNIIAERRPLLSEAVFVAVDDDRGFVTPEGRVLLDELERAEQSSTHIINRDTLIDAYALIADFYGSSNRQWMRKELAGGNLRPATLGFAVFLLINNSLGSKRALLLPSSIEEEHMLAGRILPVVSEFSTSIGGSPVKQGETDRLRSNWIITETKRQLGPFITRIDDSRTVKFWIEEKRELGLIDELGRQLARRRSLSVSDLREALDRTLIRYNTVRPMLTSWGLAHERTGHTTEVFDGLIRSFTRSSGA